MSSTSMNSNTTPPKRQGASWQGLLAGGAVLLLVAVGVEVLEPFLMATAVTADALAGARSSSAAGWANSSVWLTAEVVCLLGVALAGFVGKRLAPTRSWWAPGLLLALCVGYVFFAQFPATRVPWRIALWSVGTPVAFCLGAMMARWRLTSN